MPKKLACVLLFIIAMSAVLCGQQTQGDRPSPASKAECRLPDKKSISVEYSSPRMRGRKIFSGLVPYGQIWRTGANEATTFVTNEDLVTAGATNIPVGSYTIFTIPNSDKWILIINKHTGEWGIPYDYQPEELARVPMTVTKLTSPIENFTISFDHSPTGCTMHVSWENTDASLTFNTKNTDTPVMP